MYEIFQHMIKLEIKLFDGKQIDLKEALKLLVTYRRKEYENFVRFYVIVQNVARFLKRTRLLMV